MPTVNNREVRCVECDDLVTDPRLQKVYVQEDYPDIDIGPYCASCFQKARICSGCQHPFLKGQGIKYFGSGNYYCTSCAEDLITCDICGKECSSPVEIHGKKYCNSCKDQYLFKCKVCDDWHKRSNNYFSQNPLNQFMYPEVYTKYSGNVCMGCQSKATFGYERKEVGNCGHCGSVFTKSKSDDKYCKSCWDSFKTCSVCNKRHPRVSSRVVDDHDGINYGSTKKVCDTCYNKMPHCSLCESICEIHTKIKGAFYESKVCRVCSHHHNGRTLGECSSCLQVKRLGSDGMCNDCSRIYGEGNRCSCGLLKDSGGNCRVCSERGTYNYSYAPQLKFLHTKKEYKHPHKIFFGFENEVTYGEDRSTCDSKMRDLYKTHGPEELFTKGDSSIRGYGYEIVTMPMTLDYFKTMNLSQVTNSDQINNKSCGLHIHVSRKSFRSDVHTFKVVNFIHENEKFASTIAGRDYTSYNAKIESKVSTKVKKKVAGARYCRVNMSNNRTIEFRMFAGCITEFELRYRVEFLHALLTFTNKVSIVKAKSVKAFKEFVKNNGKDYPNLNKFLKNKVNN